MSNSPRFKAHHVCIHGYRRDSSAPCVSEARGGAFISFFPHMREGAERRLALRIVGTFRRCRVPLPARAPPGAPLVAFLLSGRSSGRRTDELSLRPDPGGQPAPPFIRSTSSHLRQPRLATERAVIRDDPGPGYVSQEPRATPCSVHQASLEDALN